MREIVTTKLEEEFGEEKLKCVVLAFRFLMQADKHERHFEITFCNSDEGRGKKVWCIVDEYSEAEGGRTATYLLPSDY